MCVKCIHVLFIIIATNFAFFSRNPFYIPKKGLSCLGDYGGPVFPYVALGGFEDNVYSNATALIITLMVKNHVNEEDNEDAIEWEKKYV